MKTILVQGASTAAGWYDMESAGWVSRLNRSILPINSVNPQEAILVQNDSVPGTTLPAILREMMPRVERLQKMGTLTTILAVGLNETKIREERQQPLISKESFKERLSEYSSLLESRSINTVFVGIELLSSQYITTENGNIFDDSLTIEYDTVIKEHAHSRQMPFINTKQVLGLAGVDNAVSYDGYHPNEFGHQAIFESVKKALENLGSLTPSDKPSGFHPEIA